MPAMQAAIAALDTLKQNDISIVKAMQNPPSGIKLVLEAVCILKVRPSPVYLYQPVYRCCLEDDGIVTVLWFQGIKPERKTDASGKPFDDYWPAAKKVTVV